MSAWTSLVQSRFARLSVAFVALAMLGACDGDGGTEPMTDSGTPPAPDGGTDPMTDGGTMPAMSIADIAAGNPDFSMLVAAAARADLVEVLNAPGTYTVFAPTNAAFEASGISMDAIEAMPVEQLTAVLTYHALGSRVPSSAVTAGVVPTLSTLSLVVGTTGGVTLNGGNTVQGGANVTATDIEASNGIIHVIDRVLLPPTVADLARYAGLTSLVGALTSADLVSALQGEGPFTVFAPTNAAFEALPEVPTGAALTNVLLYHVVSGAAVPSSSVPDRASAMATNRWSQNLTLLFDTSSGVTINGMADVVIADVRGTNGIVHVIDTVLLPMNVVDLAVAAGLTQLVGAVTAAADIPGPPAVSVADALQDDQPYTVFAPTNAAFEAIASTVMDLSDAQVRDVLLYHVLNPETFTTPVLSTALPAGTTPLATVNGQTADLDTTVTPPTIDGSGIIATDFIVTNGVVHLIDAVMVPTL